MWRAILAQLSESPYVRSDHGVSGHCEVSRCLANAFALFVASWVIIATKSGSRILLNIFYWRGDLTVSTTVAREVRSVSQPEGDVCRDHVIEAPFKGAWRLVWQSPKNLYLPPSRSG